MHNLNGIIHPHVARTHMNTLICPRQCSDIGGNVHGMYELAAVLTHVGRTADAGHYMAWVRSEESADDWWKFDDDKVTAVKAEDVAKLNGGGRLHSAWSGELSV